MKTGVITFNRNDGYKERERIIIHLRTLLDTFDEVNYVDWNSPTHSSLYDVIHDIPNEGRIKHFIIPPFVHTAIVGDRKVSKCLGNFAFNIALRRTDSDWIVCTTTDNIPPTREELHNIIDKSDGNTFYTLSRREIQYDDALKNINNLQTFRESLSKTTEPRMFYARVTPNDNYSIINCCGDFQLAPTKLWLNIKGLEEQMIYNCFLDTNVQKKAVLAGYNLQAIFDVPMYHMSHKNILPQAHTTELHEVAEEAPIYNDALEWVEYFTESKNDDNW